MLSEFRTNTVRDGPLVEVGCRRQLLALDERAGGLPDGDEDGEPELMRVLLVAPHLNHCQSIPPTGPIRPGPQQRGLAAACGARDKRYLRFRRAIEGPQKLSPLNQPPRSPPPLSLPSPHPHPPTRHP